MTQPMTADCLADASGIAHGFFTRAGGVSGGIYGSLNCGLGSRDDRDAVTENRRRVSAALGRPDVPLLTCHQVHSAEALVVTEPWPSGSSPKADALVTRQRGVVVGALAADCAPVLFADPEAGVVASAHAGWKGALTGVLEATIEAMERIGARRQRIRAALGPCISGAAYEVGPEFEARFLAWDPVYERFFQRSTPDSRPRFDLPQFVLARLASAGLDTVENCTRCTYANEGELFSYRRTTHRGEPDYGRQVSAIVLL